MYDELIKSAYEIAEVYRRDGYSGEIVDQLREAVTALIDRAEAAEADRDKAVEDVRAEARCSTCAKHRVYGGACSGFGACGYKYNRNGMRKDWQWRGRKENKC